MRVLLSTIGSRGDVQPLVALGVYLKSRGHEARLCVPPDFRAWIEDLGLAVTPIGPEVRSFAAARPTAAGRALPTPEERRQLAEATVATQFETLAGAAEGSDVVVAASALQIAARSIAERRRIPYVFVAYSPTVLPSVHHAPPPLPPVPGQPEPEASDNLARWARNAERFDDLFGAALDAHRARIGLPPVADVSSYMFGDRPWLAADATLGPWPDGDHVFQTGAWILADERPLSRELETFLAAGDPPIYFGFGSTRVSENTGRAALDAARAHGRRAVVSQGWFDESLVENTDDCVSIGDANLHALFPRMSAVVHHGGAGTTTAAALAGTPQVVVPNRYDQHYWAERVHQLGIGAAHAAAAPTADSLTRALAEALRPDVAARARAVARSVRRDGVDAATRELERTTRSFVAST